MLSSFYRQAGVETFLQLPNAIGLYELKTKYNIQLRQEIGGGENQVESIKENYWGPNVQLPNISPPLKIGRRYRARACFTLS